MKNSEQPAGQVAEISNGSDTSDSKTPPEGRVQDNSMCPHLPIAPSYTRFRFYYQENNFDLNALRILCHLLLAKRL